METTEMSIKSKIEKQLASFKDNLITDITVDILQMEVDKNNEINRLDKIISLNDQKINQLLLQNDNENKKSTDLSDELKVAQERLNQVNENLEKEKNSKKLIEDKLKSIEQNNSQLITTVEFYENSFKKIKETYDCLKRLNENTKKSLIHLFKSDVDIEGFLASGMNLNAVKAIYDIAKDKIVNHSEDNDFEFLNTIYLFFLSALVTNTKDIVKVEPEIDADYSESEQISIKTKQLRGKIKKVVLIGLKDKNDIKKAIVEIE